jgi:hypothetical protein
MRGRGTRLAVYVLAALLGGCSAGPHPMTVERALERESLPLPLADAASVDGTVLLRVEAAAPPRVVAWTSDGGAKGYTIEVPTGKGSAIECALAPNISSSASFWRSVHGELHGGVLQNPRLVATDAGAMVDHPFLYLEVAGTVVQDGENRTRIVKYLAVGIGNGTLLCSHPVVGYRETFKRIVSGLVANLRAPGVQDELPLTYHEIEAMKIQDRALGFADLRYFSLGPQGHLAAKRTSLVIPRSPADWLVLDSLRVERSAADGTITQAADSRTSGDEQERDLALIRDGTGYRVDGTLSGKAVHADLPHTKPVPDDIDAARRLRETVLNNGPWPLSLPQWSPDVNPLAITDASLGCQPGDTVGAASCEMKAGTSNLRFSADEVGRPRIITLSGPNGITITLERVFVRGHL